jgi:hypothetical protein
VFVATHEEASLTQVWFITGAAILEVAEQTAMTLQAQADAFGDLSSSLVHDNA